MSMKELADAAIGDRKILDEPEKPCGARKYEELRKGLGCGMAQALAKESAQGPVKNLSSKIMKAFYYNSEKKHPEFILLLLTE